MIASWVVCVGVHNVWLIFGISVFVPCLNRISRSVKLRQNKSTLLNKISCCRSEFSLFIDGSSSTSHLILLEDKSVCSVSLSNVFHSHHLTWLCSNLLGETVQFQGRSTSPSTRLSRSRSRKTSRAGPDHRVGADGNWFQSKLIMACTLKHFLET